LLAGGALAGAITSRIAPALRGPTKNLDDKPNVIIFLLDALRADHLGCYGYRRNTAPNIDRIAAEGTRFENAHASSAVTFQSMMSLHTSYEYPSFDPTYERRPLVDFPTFPEVFKREGWHTKTLTANPWHYACSWNTRGYAQEDILIPEPYLDRNNEWIEWWCAEAALKQARDKMFSNLQQPFMWYIHLMPPHEPYAPSDRFMRRFGCEYEGQLPEDVYSHPVDLRKHLDMLSAEDVRHVVDLYDANILSGDWFVGAIVSRLEWLDILDDTIVVVTSDHGEEFREHGGFGHDGTVYQEDVRIPLVFRYPKRVLAAKVVTDLVSMIDIAPTILELAGIPMQFGRGKSMVPMLSRSRYPGHRDRAFSDCLGIAMRKGDIKCICYDWPVDATEGKWRRGLGPSLATEVYDLCRDPTESRNLAGRDPALEAELVEDVKSWVESNAALGPSDPRAVPKWNEELLREMHMTLRGKQGRGEDVDIKQLFFADKHLAPDADGGIDPETRERLKALGYIGDTR